jgi:2-oxoglutarate dehydrogenase E1 component
MATPQQFQQDSYLYGPNAVFVQEMFARYTQDANSVDESWQVFFASFAGEAASYTNGNANGQIASSSKVLGVKLDEPPSADKNKGKSQSPAISEEQLKAAAEDSIRALMLIRSYRVRGHLNANLDPLGLEKRKPHPELEPGTYGFSEADYDRPIYLAGVLGKQFATMREIITILRNTYCTTMGVEFMHIESPEQKQWIQERIESTSVRPKIAREDKNKILRDLAEIESFESFLQLKYPSTKRFSIQGGDAAIAGLEQCILTASNLGVDEIVIGMPHRGRMNVLTTVMGKPYVELLSIFHGNMNVPDSVQTSGDVKYHLGVSSDRPLSNGKTIHLSLTANPSHLEAVNPVVLGKVRAKQDQRDDVEKSKVMPILLHGDAAFSGQGIVAEGLALSELKGYKVGGCIHIIVNNQIGFTTSPRSQRSTPYPSDVAKGVQAPIFHVNGDDPEAVAYVCRLAVEFRQAFKRDVVIDVFCFRRYGHNESDEPSFTQPLMYDAIRKHKLPARIYADQLVAEGVMTNQDIDEVFEEFRKHFDAEFEAAQNYRPNKADWLGGYWSGFARPDEGELPQPETGVKLEILREIGEAISRVPSEFTINSKIIRQLEAKRNAIKSGEGIDWATGEALAFGTLLTEGYPVRLTGQDCRRGTFSHRHAVLIDQQNEKNYKPLDNIKPGQKQLEIYDSNLSEFAILGYEYGYASAEPNALVLWEAQFGDFSNGAQVIIDQFIASGEIKWLRMNGLVMLLPHGYEGQGPEHSSARLERYLQLCAEDNMQVINCTTPANYYHMLRRQIHRNFRKPVVLMSPKSLLRHRLAVSTLSDMGPKTTFLPVIEETEKLASANKVKRVVFCSGKVYYDLLEAREAAGIKDVALVRLEQFYPFPSSKVKQVIKNYPSAEIIWCQEEPRNMGGWSFVNEYFEEAATEVRGKFERPRYVGRKSAASPATGYLKTHEAEQKALVEEALNDSIANGSSKKVRRVA